MSTLWEDPRGTSLFWDGAAGGTMTRSDVECGVHGGFKGGGFAETNIRRSQSLRNSKAGVALGNFKALDLVLAVRRLRHGRDEHDRSGSVSCL